MQCRWRVSVCMFHYSTCLLARGTLPCARGGACGEDEGWEGWWLGPAGLGVEMAWKRFMKWYYCGYASFVLGGREPQKVPFVTHAYGTCTRLGKLKMSPNPQQVVKKDVFLAIVNLRDGQQCSSLKHVLACAKLTKTRKTCWVLRHLSTRPSVYMYMHTNTHVYTTNTLMYLDRELDEYKSNHTHTP